MSLAISPVASQYLRRMTDYQSSSELRPQIQNYDLAMENPRGEKYSLNLSLFERLISPPGNGIRLPSARLETQRRMHPSIAKIVRQTLYPQLEDHSSVYKYPEISGMRRRLYWLDHRVKESGGDPSQPNEISYSNDYEVEMTAALASHLVRQGTFGSQSLAIITPYLLQLRKIRNRLSSAFEVVVGDVDIEDMRRGGLDEPELRSTTQEVVAQKTTLLKAVRVATVGRLMSKSKSGMPCLTMTCRQLSGRGSRLHNRVPGAK